MEDLAGHERRPLQVEDPVDHVADRAQASERVELGESRVGGGIVDGRLDDAEGHGVDADPTGGILDREGARHGCQSALGEHRQGGGPVTVGVIDEARADVDDVA